MSHCSVAQEEIRYSPIFSGTMQTGMSFSSRQHGTCSSKMDPKKESVAYEQDMIWQLVTSAKLSPPSVPKSQ
jgi:hypothetical protein